MCDPVMNVAKMREWDIATRAGGQSEAKVIQRVTNAMAVKPTNLQLANPESRYRLVLEQFSTALYLQIRVRT